MLKHLVSVLIRQAKIAAPSSPAVWLTQLQTAKLDGLTKSGGAISSTSVNGTSVSVQIPPGFGPVEVLAALELAIQCVESGASGVSSTAQGVLR